MESVEARPGENASECLAEALLHVARGFSTLPLRATKEPNVPLIRRTRGTGSWKTFQNDRADEAEVRAWFEHHPETAIGIVTGEVSGDLVVVDDDGAAPIVEVPTTATVTTARGRHLYFRTSDPVRSRDFPWGEIRANGRYVVAPRSLHPLGVRYRWHLSPEEAGVADFAECDITQSPAATPIRSTCPEGTSIRSTCHATSLVEVDEGPALLLARALGVPDGVEIGESFPCLLHADGRPSAALWRAHVDYPVLYHDFHGARHGGDVWLPLSKVRARLAGREGWLGKPELAVWRLRLLAEAGLFAPVEIEAPTAPADLDRLWRGFLGLLGLRWRVSLGKPAPFSVRFAAAWCGLPKRETHEGLRRLDRLGLVHVVGHDARGTRLWLPEGVRPLA